MTNFNIFLLQYNLFHLLSNFNIIVLNEVKFIFVNLFLEMK